MKKRFPYPSSLYWKISAALLFILALVGLGYLFISSYSTRQYVQEANQQLYGEVASYMVKETHPIIHGEVDTAATHDIMHAMMVINRSVEVYLLDPTGRIIDCVVPTTEVKREGVDLTPIRTFIAADGNEFIVGDDPKEPGVRKTFSAAPIYEDDTLVGYA
ncbi:MAG: sensor histidine kinase, partial [Lewinella sp.]|nr:sensor histidine kinase [Lewinella sp.]